MLLFKNIQEIASYRPATLRIGKEWSIEYYAFNPAQNKLARKKIKLNHIDKISVRRQYAFDLIKNLNTKLSQCWNPFIMQESNKGYKKFTEASDHFLAFIKKRYADKKLRDETWYGYSSYMKMLCEWMSQNK